MWLRSGDTSSANNFLGFLEDTLSKVKSKTVSLIRLDSGFFQSGILAIDDDDPCLSHYFGIGERLDRNFRAET